MVPQPSDTTRSEFPHPTESVKLGWHFFRANLWPVLVFGGLMGIAYAIAEPFVDRLDDDGVSAQTVVLNGLAAFVILTVGTVFELGLWRRALDYWDETHGLASPRGTADALRAAVDGAIPRVMPYIGWSILWVAAFMAFIVVGLLIGDAFSIVGLLLAALVIWIALYLLDFMTAFFAIAAADRPGNPLSRSIHVFKGHFWRIVGAYLLFGLVALVGVIPVIVLMVVFDGSGAATVVGAIGVIVVIVVLLGAFAGARVAMYRSVYTPEA